MKEQKTDDPPPFSSVSVRGVPGGWPPGEGCKGAAPPLPKKILYLVSIRYAISIPILVKTCLIFVYQIIEKKHG